MNNFKLLIFLLIFTFIKVGYTQNPYYFTIGEKELSGAEVYSVIETKEEVIYVATDIGLFKYEKNKFILIDSPKEQIRNSLFNLIQNKNGDIFCSNLDGQIFSVKNKELHLFATLPKESISINTFIKFDNQDNLIALTKDCFRVTKDSIYLIKKSTPAKSGYKMSLNKLQNGELLIHELNSDSLSIIENGICKPYAINKYKKNRVALFSLNNQLFSNNSIGEIERYENKNLEKFIIPQVHEEIFQVKENEVWLKGNRKGVRAISNINDTVKVTSLFFEDRFISTLCVNKNTAYFGTFGQGILVVPNFDLKLCITEESGTKINDIAIDKNNNVFLVKSKKGIYHYKKNLKTIEEDANKTYANVFVFENAKVGINKNYPQLYYEAPFLIDNCAYLEYVNDAFNINEEIILFATSKGLVIKSPKVKQDTTNWKNISDCVQNFYFHRKINKRCISVVADTINSLIYVATATSVYEIDRKGEIKELVDVAGNFLCNKLIFYKEKLWCATKNKGLLVFKKGELIEKIDEKNGLINSPITQLKVNNNLLFLTNEVELQTIDLNTTQKNTYGAAEGFFGILNDIEFSKDKLWILSDKKDVKSIKLKKLIPAQQTINLYLDSITVLEKKIPIDNTINYKYNQNHFRFFLSIRSIKQKNHTTINYRIKGLENDWNTLEDNSKIEYKSLPPGNYTFESYAQYTTTKSNIITYSFKIYPPYWQEWWFYILLLICSLAITLLLFKIRIGRIKNKNKDLIEKQTLKTNLIDLELKALRSQMNPHFIFNALNSIQDLILKEETEASYDYIVLFSELVRNTLNYSNKDFIPIESELEFIEVYLKLEKLRFEDNFNYEINYNNISNILVPSLIVQPFIENALKHGLMHQEGEKRLIISFKLTDQLVCTITDNGIGRVEAKKIQKRQGNNHESFALKAIKKRLEILSNKNGDNFGYVVTDLYKNEIPSGTQIKVTIPHKSLC